MRKVVFILYLEFIVVSCSITRKTESDSSNTEKNFTSENVLESTINQNLTNISFLISKAEIEIKDEKNRERFIGIIKFEYPDKYLLSIKSRTGIEGMRIYITKDSLLVNDRINKKMYIGTSVYMKQKYRLSTNLLPLIVGDIVLNKNMGSVKNECVGDIFSFKNLADGVLLNYNIDCKKRKTLFVTEMNNYGKENHKIIYENFFYAGGILVPRVIKTEDSKSGWEIMIKIIKIVRPWNGKIKFVPGNGYELIELL